MEQDHVRGMEQDHDSPSAGYAEPFEDERDAGAPAEMDATSSGEPSPDRRLHEHEVMRFAGLHRSKLNNFAGNLIEDPSAAEQCVDDALARLRQQAADGEITVRSQSHLHRLIFRAVRVKCHERLRKATQRRLLEESNEAAVRDATVSNEKDVEVQTRANEILQRAAKELPERQVRVLELRLEGDDVPEIAKKLHVSETTVKRDLSSVRKWLSPLVDALGVACLPPWLLAEFRPQGSGGHEVADTATTSSSSGQTVPPDAHTGANPATTPSARMPSRVVYGVVIGYFVMMPLMGLVLSKCPSTIQTPDPGLNVTVAVAPESSDRGRPPQAAVRGDEIVISQQVQFDTDKATIKTVSDNLLDAVAGVLREQPEILRVEVQGHTDNRGTRAHNEDLSQRRAEAVVKALVQRGIAASRMSGKGYGQDVPISDNKTEAGRQQNRRVQFIILERKVSPPAPSAWPGNGGQK